MQTLNRWAAGALAFLLLGTGLLLSDSVVNSFGGGSGALPNGPNAAVTSFPRDEVRHVAIEMAAEDLETMLANGMEEKEYHASVTWNGQPFPHVAIRTKGNSSLMSVARSGAHRYSFKLDLDAYLPGQTLNGIGTINLNNNFSDPTYLREYLSYEAFASLNVATPAMTWVNVTLNGKPWGLYLAVEQIGQPYLTRHFGNGTGDLYKPAGQAGQGADLKWYGDSYDNYPGIVYKTKGKSATHQPLLKMLDALNNGGDLERYIDVDGVLRYLAVSTVLVDMDSYLGPLAHNYYLYEQNGKFTVLPWDLNMSFAGFGMGGGGEQSAGVKIDEPTSGALADRPLIAKLLEVPAYRERYHGYIEELITGYLEPERFEARAREVAALLAPHVKEDPTKFYTYEEFERSLEEGLTRSGAALPEGGAQVAPGQAPGAPGQMSGARGQMPGAPRQAPGGGQGQPWRQAPQGEQGDQFAPGPINLAGPGGNVVGLLPFVRERVENIQQQLDGRLPTKGDGSSAMGGGRFGFGPGQAGEGPAPVRRAPEGIQVPGNFQLPEGAIPEGFQPPQGFRPPDGNRMGGGFRPPGGAGMAPPSVAGVPLDQVVPLAGAVGLLVGGTLLIWRLRPRL